MEKPDSILLIQRRYHTNQHPVVKTLLQRGHDVRFLALRRQRSEEYSALEPDFARFSPVFLMLESILRPLLGSHIRHHYGFPPLLWYYRYLRDADPDLIVIKKYMVISLVTILYAKILEIDIVFYDQRPIYGEETFYVKRKIAAAMYFLVHGEPFVRITPVLGDRTKELARPRSYYLPFVAPTWLAPDNRTYFEDNRINIIMIGKLHSRRKNHVRLLDVVDELASEYDLHLTIVGALKDENHPHYREIIDFIEANEMAQDVTIKKNLSYHEVQREYRKQDVYVLPSRNEPAAVSHLEAMNNGLAIICSDTNGTSHYVRTGENGFLFSCNDRADLLKKTESVISSRERVREFGQRSMEIAQSEFSPEKYYESFTAIVAENFAYN